MLMMELTAHLNNEKELDTQVKNLALSFGCR